jgi:tetratricopeptide (TPR) repeat protein
MRIVSHHLVIRSLAATAALLAVSTAVHLHPVLAETVDAADEAVFTAPRTLVGNYLSGRIARDNNDTAKAAEYYSGALIHDPDNAVLIEQAFMSEASEGFGPNAEKMAERLVATEPQHRLARMFLGVRDFKAGSYKSSEQHFRAASSGPIGELTSALALSWVKLAARENGAALDELDAPKQADWAQFYLRYHRGLIADLAGRKQEARTAFDRVFKQDPKALRTSLAYARHALHEGDTKLAKTVIAEHINKSQGESHAMIRALLDESSTKSKTDFLIQTPAQGLAEAFYGLGEALINEGAVAAGVHYLQLALAVEPGHEFALAAMANAYETVKRYDDSIATYDKIPANSPLNMQVQIHRAYNLNSLDRADEATAVLNGLLDQLAIGAKAAPTPAQASETAKSADVTTNIEQPLALGSRGNDVRQLQRALRKLGYKKVDVDGFFGESTRRAVKAVQKKNGIESDGMAGDLTLAAIEGSGADPVASETNNSAAANKTEIAGAAQKADIVTDQLLVLDALGSIQRARKQFGESVETYSRILNLIPKIGRQHWAYFYARGTSFERQKNWPAAEADLKKALELAPGEPLVLNYLGYSWIDQGVNLKQGMTLIEKAVALKPDDGYTVDSLGWALFKQGNFREAVRYLERAVELRPDDPILNDHLGDALWRSGREREARFQWDQATTLNPEPEDLEKIKKKLAGGLDNETTLRSGSLVTPPAPAVKTESDPAIVQ